MHGKLQRRAHLLDETGTIVERHGNPLWRYIQMLLPSMENSAASSFNLCWAFLSWMTTPRVLPMARTNAKRDDSYNELRDYLVVVDPYKEHHAIPSVDRLKKLVTLHRRQRSDATAQIVGAPVTPSHCRHRSEMPNLFSEGIATSPGTSLTLPRPSGATWNFP